jgi:hypothetical protein
MPGLWYCGVYSQNSEIYINILKLCKTNITCNVTCFSCTWRHKTFPFTVLFQTATFEMQRHLFSAYMTSFPPYRFPLLFQNIFIFVTESIFYKFYYFPQFSFSSENLFLLSILQNVIASKSNHIIYTILPNEMVFAPLQKLKIKYELSYQSTNRLKCIDKFDQLLIIHQWTSTVDNTVRSLIHFTIFIWCYVVKHFPSFMKSSLNNWCPIKMFIVLHVWILFSWHRQQ